jgi:hypothetical protein
MPAPTPEPTPAPDPVTGATVGLTKGTVSHQTGCAIPSGEELTSPSDGFMELDLGNGNYVLLFQDTQATLLRFGSQLQVNVSHGWMSFYFGAPEKLDCSLTWVTDLCSADMTSRCGYMCRERGAGYVQIVSYLGEMTLHLKDGATAATTDGVFTMVKGGQTVEEREPFSGKFQGMKTMILNHQEMAEPLAAAYDMTPGAVLLTVGIRTEPEIIIRDLGNGTYDRSVIDVNGDVVVAGENVGEFNLFGTGELNIPLLGEIPLVQSIAESGDSGKPAALFDPANTKDPVREAFDALAQNTIREICKLHVTK